MPARLSSALARSVRERFGARIESAQLRGGPKCPTGTGCPSCLRNGAQGANAGASEGGGGTAAAATRIPRRRSPKAGLRADGIPPPATTPIAYRGAAEPGRGTPSRNDAAPAVGRVDDGRRVDHDSWGFVDAKRRRLQPRASVGRDDASVRPRLAENGLVGRNSLRRDTASTHS